MGKTEAPAEPKMIELVSPSDKLWISLETNVDDYSALGGMRTVKRGDRVRFRGGRARVPEHLLESVKQTRGFNRDFFLAEDPRSVLQRSLGGPQVVAGQLRTRLPEADAPPLPDWDKTGARDLRTAINDGKVDDLQGAMLWETRPNGGKARTQVIDAIGKAIRDAQGGEDEDEDQQDTSPTDTEGDGEPVPSDEGGL